MTTASESLMHLPVIPMVTRSQYDYNTSGGVLTGSSILCYTSIESFPGRGSFIMADLISRRGHDIPPQ